MTQIFANVFFIDALFITLENSVFETIFIVNHVLKVSLVPKVPFITKTEFSSVRSILLRF
jgi:hypothetical protein